MENENNYYYSKQASFSVFGLVRYAIASFLAIQIIGFFGVIIALAYPLFWFFFPNKTLCFYCFHLSFFHPERLCPVCKKPAGQIYNPPLFSVFVNATTIFIFSLAATVIVFLEIHFLAGPDKFGFLPFGRQNVSLVLPEKNKFEIGKDFYLDISVAAEKTPVNVVQTDLKFDPDLLSVSRIDTENSMMTIFTQKDFSNEEGWIRIVGGITSPGFLGERSIFARVFFMPKKTGVSEIEFLKTSKILAADGEGTVLPNDFRNAKVEVVQHTDVLGGEMEKNLEKPWWEKFMFWRN